LTPPVIVIVVAVIVIPVAESLVVVLTVSHVSPFYHTHIAVVATAHRVRRKASSRIARAL
jgi:hypothetical protein